MALRTGHGNGKGTPRIEVLPADELPAGVPGIDREAPPQVDRDESGRFASKAAAREIGRRGGLTKRNRARLANQLGLANLASMGDFKRYRLEAEKWQREQLKYLAKSVGGGFCGPGVAAILGNAALQLAAARFLFDQASKTHEPDLFVQASRLSNDHKQNQLCAYELAAKEAKSRLPELPAWWKDRGQ